MKWDPMQYARYAGERGRPFVDLIAQIDSDAPAHVVDLGCGPGDLTALLAKRWPHAQVTGLDSSSEMIATAGQAVTDVDFQLGDVTEWFPSPDIDVIISNATLQWVPGHQELLRSWITALKPGAWLAVQVPANFDSPSHLLMRDIAESPRWAPQLGQVLRHADAVAAPEDYARLLLDCGMTASVWQTRYLHLLPGNDPVLEWVRGTGLRPILAALSPDEAHEFEKTYAAALRRAYPASAHGTFFPFLRTFFVGHRL
jgi:trans-aconitate 2-methyltransferase